MWPLARLPLIDEQSGLATSSRTPPAAFSNGLQPPCTRRSAGTKLQQGLSVQTRSKARQAQHKSAGPRGKQVRQKQNRSVSAASASDSGTAASSATSHATASDAEWNSKDNGCNGSSENSAGSEDSIHTAHFSDEGELSDMDGEVASAQAASAKRQKTDAGVKVLYHGPSSDQLAAAAAAAMAPAGPRPLLGDVLSEVIHVQDVKRSACATGVPDEPLKEEDWRCIMRHKNAVGCELDHNVNGVFRSSVNGFYMPKTACRRSRHCLEATVWYHVEKACRACWLFDADAQHALTAITACTLCGGL